jgi:hypothetical protein
MVTLATGERVRLEAVSPASSRARRDALVELVRARPDPGVDPGRGGEACSVLDQRDERAGCPAAR